MVKMGDRVSIQFKDAETGELSVTLFSHWGGMDFVLKALEYAKELKKDAEIEGAVYPLYRLEASTVMVDFIRDLTQDGARTVRNLYLGATPEDGDNSDNGNFIIDLSTMSILHD